MRKLIKVLFSVLTCVTIFSGFSVSANSEIENYATVSSPYEFTECKKFEYHVLYQSSNTKNWLCYGTNTKPVKDGNFFTFNNYYKYSNGNSPTNGGSITFDDSGYITGSLKFSKPVYDFVKSIGSLGRYEGFFPKNLQSQVEVVALGEVMEVTLEILPIVVLSIVSFLGLRKAWNWLLVQLRVS